MKPERLIALRLQEVKEILMSECMKDIYERNRGIILALEWVLTDAE